LLPEGGVAPDFRLQGWSLREALKAGPALLVFFKISCPTCQFTLPFLRRFEGSGLQVAAISQDDQTATAEFCRRFQVSLLTLLDKAWDFPVSSAFRIGHVPSLFLIETDGTISLAVEGFSKAHLEALGTRFGVAPFESHESVPALRPG
jgi:peroxiredoxin